MKYFYKLLTYLLIFLSICAFGIFIYPGLYKYDKLNQKFPVKINRLTGSTQVLYADGWRSMDGFDSAAEKMDGYKQEIEQRINEQNESIKEEVLNSIRDELESVKSDIISEQNVSDTSGSKYDAVRNRNDDSSIEDISDGFSKGDSMDKVQEIMGTPSGITSVGEYETWFYGLSTVKFEGGKVTGWHDLDNNLLIK